MIRFSSAPNDMKYTFSVDDIRNIIKESRSAEGFRNYMNSHPEEPGAWLVGDQGVYIMSNRTRPDKEPPFVTYAKEANPNQDLDDWWHAKANGFGADDGVEFIDMDMLDEWVKTNKPYVYIVMDSREFVLSH